ncbi:hypothetical protein ACOL3B_10390 [Aliarcobacter butzleri]
MIEDRINHAQLLIEFDKLQEERRMEKIGTCFKRAIFCFNCIGAFIWYNTYNRRNNIKKGVKMQETITIVSGLLSIVGLYWAFMEKLDKQAC